MNAAHPYEVIEKTDGEQCIRLYFLNRIFSLTKPEHMLSTVCSGFFYFNEQISHYSEKIICLPIC